MQRPIYGAIVLIALFLLIGAFAEDSWSYILIADWHGAESFAIDPVSDEDPNLNQTDYYGYRNALININNTYGGELLVLPGDSNTGHWYTEEFVQKFQASMKRSMTQNEVIAQAGYNCYSTMKRMFSESGYEKVLLAVGDHEIGGNPWKTGPKIDGLTVFRQSLVTEMNEKDGLFAFPDPIGKAPSRPIGTDYENTSYAYVHKNALFVTVDAFYYVGSSFYARETNEGGEGQVACTVEGEHLAWFESVLAEASKDESIKHIFVQAHLPIAQPVRKMSCSGQFFDRETDSDFWKLMQQYNVDVYFAGEVHSMTVTKDPDSNLIQILSRGNRLQNFLHVKVLDDGYAISAYNEIGEKPRFNANYTQFGFLSVKKTGSDVLIRSYGALKLMDKYKKALIWFRFERDEEHALLDRQVLGMKYDQLNEALIGHTMTIRNTTSSKGIRNYGVFEEQYNLQVVNHDFDSGVDGDAIVLKNETEVAVYSMGPMGQGEMITTSLYFKTAQSREMILIFYGGRFGYNSKKDIFLLTLNNGNPILYFATNRILNTTKSFSLDDGRWHHISVSMPSTSCLMSEVLVYIDGQRVETYIDGADKHIFYVTSGQLSLGGWGYSNKIYGTKIFSDINKFEGMMDNFQLWGGRTVSEDKLIGTVEKQFEINQDMRCKKRKYRIVVGILAAKNCRIQCEERSSCRGYEVRRKKRGKKYRCFHFEGKVELGDPLIGSQCNPVLI